MLYGVRDAIALGLDRADAGPLTILGDLVHNPTVLRALEAKGITVAQDVAHVKTPTLMVTAHGTSGRTLARTRALGLTVVEATCPLVHVAHRAVAALAREGYHVVIVGQRDHVEVRGLTGDLDRFDVVLEEDDVLALEEHPRIGVAAQTTQAIESNNTRELVNACERYCARAHHVETDAEVRPEWFEAAHIVGLTAGTSTPGDVTDRVETRIRLCADASAGQVRRVEDYPP